MAHFRPRYAAGLLKKLSRLWPVVGVIGPRQVGKTSLIEHQIPLNESASLDDEETRADAQASAKAFLGRLSAPALIDEVQKAPKLFDALKLHIHSRKRPGQFFLTGSVSFSEGSAIRESLTGRIGLCRLYGLTLGEAEGLEAPSRAPEFTFKTGQKPRVEIDAFSRAMKVGGLPVPMFLRDPAQRAQYWSGWLSTTLIRDLGAQVRKGYEPDFAQFLLQEFGRILAAGELPQAHHFQVRSRAKLMRYLAAMESIFLLRKLTPHPLAVGKPAWLLHDSGLASHLIGSSLGEGTALSLARHTLWNELSALFEYAGDPQPALYFKSAKGSPVDLVIKGIPIRVVMLSEIGHGSWGWQEKAVLGAIKHLGAPFGILAAPVSKVFKSGKIWIVPWTAWS
ncbi:MAG: AAA family ATPase [Oligoflexia bacterium]|nr:AAA family ATPase [Oligoflexia bacterium]